MLSVRQAAERVGVCQRILRAWINEGRLPCYRLGVKGSRGKISIAVNDLDEVLASFRVRVEKPAAKPKRKQTGTPFKFIKP